MKNVNQFIEKNLCEIEDDCTCSKIINSRDKHKLFDDVHRKKIKDKVIEEIFEHKTCKIFDKEKQKHIDLTDLGFIPGNYIGYIKNNNDQLVLENTWIYLHYLTVIKKE